MIFQSGSRPDPTRALIDGLYNMVSGLEVRLHELQKEHKELKERHSALCAALNLVYLPPAQTCAKYATKDSGEAKSWAEYVSECLREKADKL